MERHTAVKVAVRRASKVESYSVYIQIQKLSFLLCFIRMLRLILYYDLKRGYNHDLSQC
jgi:hypothetical protein